MDKFKENASSCIKQVSKVESFFNLLLNDANTRNLMYNMLSVANFTNSGTTKENAYGFKCKSL